MRSQDKAGISSEESQNFLSVKLFRASASIVSSRLNPDSPSGLSVSILVYTGTNFIIQTLIALVCAGKENKTSPFNFHVGLVHSTLLLNSLTPSRP
jgi:hypothetical protein